MKQIIARIRQLEAAATPGPWEMRTQGQDMNDASYKVFPYGKYEIFDYFISDAPYYNTAPNKPDVELFVEMRNVIIPLLDRLEKVEAVAEAAKDACRAIPGMLPKIEAALAALDAKGSG